MRRKNEIAAVEWGNGLSFRFLVEADRMGFTLAHTIVRAGSKSPLHYRRHLEACYCISGRGQVIAESGDIHEIEPGTLYALDEHDRHHLVASPGSDLELISIFNPPLHGDERHHFDASDFSHY
ncbi:ectoine synthase [Streptomyces alkaliphilus]|uniref:ectoine synthase n=1 Tax=Streptomyces alkaliphilus TaxID=1472722 RepID=UPI003899CDBB